MTDGPFRGDRDADQARIAALEAELAAAKDRVDELEGRRTNALVLASPRQPATAGRKLAGAPLELTLTRTFDGELSVDRFEDLLEAIRARSGERGQAEILRTSLTWAATQSPGNQTVFTMVTVRVREGRTELVVEDKLKRLAGALFGGIMGGTSSVTICAPIVAGIWLGPIGVLAGLGVSAAWLGTTFTGARALFKRGARKRAEKLQTLFDAVGAEIERMLSSQPRQP